MFHIALDGPGGAGKSTIARLIAERLGIAYLDTGAMYRAVALYMIRRGIAPDDEKRVTEALDRITIDVVYADGKQAILLNGEDVGEAIRAHIVSAAASTVSAILAVRQKLVALQQEIASRQSAVLDGRDIGTVVLPHAKYKFYLTASVEVRAGRRTAELIAKGQDVTFEQVCRDIEARDRNDMTRANSPLRVADDAVTIDSSELDVEGVLNDILNRIEEKGDE